MSVKERRDHRFFKSKESERYGGSKKIVMNHVQRPKLSDHSHVGGAAYSSSALRSSTKFPLDQGYTASKTHKNEQGAEARQRYRLTLPGQSKHLMRHSGVLEELTLRR